jgi:hypothetical protein
MIFDFFPHRFRCSFLNSSMSSCKIALESHRTRLTPKSRRDVLRYSLLFFLKLKLFPDKNSSQFPGSETTGQVEKGSDPIRRGLLFKGIAKDRKEGRGR